MQEIDEFRVDRKGIRINWQIVPRAFAHSLTSNLSRIFSSPTFFDVAFLRLVITRERSHGMQNVENRHFLKKFRSLEESVKGLRSKYGWI